MGESEAMSWNNFPETREDIKWEDASQRFPARNGSSLFWVRALTYALTSQETNGSVSMAFRRLWEEDGEAKVNRAITSGCNKQKKSTQFTREIWPV